MDQSGWPRPPENSNAALRARRCVLRRRESVTSLHDHESDAESLSNKQLRRLLIPTLERVLEARYVRERAQVERLDSILLSLSAWAPTLLEEQFIDGLVVRAKSRVASVLPAQVKDVAAELVETLAWARAVHVDGVTGRLIESVGAA
jgi:hypothetical protein